VRERELKRGIVLARGDIGWVGKIGGSGGYGQYQAVNKAGNDDGDIWYRVSPSLIPLVNDDRHDRGSDGNGAPEGTHDVDGVRGYRASRLNNNTVAEPVFPLVSNSVGISTSSELVAKRCWWKTSIATEFVVEEVS